MPLPLYWLVYGTVFGRGATVAVAHPADSTKHWPEDQFPYRPIGKMVLNEVPSNFFEHTEQVAFSPGNMLAGAIEARYVSGMGWLARGHVKVVVWMVS